MQNLPVILIAVREAGRGPLGANIEPLSTGVFLLDMLMTLGLIAGAVWTKLGGALVKLSAGCCVRAASASAAGGAGAGL